VLLASEHSIEKHLAESVIQLVIRETELKICMIRSTNIVQSSCKMNVNSAASEFDTSADDFFSSQQWYRYPLALLLDDKLIGHLS